MVYNLFYELGKSKGGTSTGYILAAILSSETVSFKVPT